MGTKVLDRIGSPAPHRVLALDGGGVRGIISIAFLEEIEALLAERAVRLGKVARPDDFRLAQYFDVIGGTSVGSIIAVLLALGWRVADVRERFEVWAPGIFRKPFYKLSPFSPKFNARTLQSRIREVLGDKRLSSEEFETVFALVAKRLDSGSPWVITNSPFSMYWEDDPASGRIGNKHFRLVDLVRASTAAPYYFAPRHIQIDAQQRGLFVDGGVSPHNNPALQLLMLVGLKGYQFHWPLGADKLLLVSVGTGSYRFRVKHSFGNRLVPGLFAVDALQGLIADSQNLSLSVLQWMSAPRHHWEINSEVGCLDNDELYSVMGSEAPILSFTRYDLCLEHGWLRAHLDKVVSDQALEFHRAFDNPRNISANYGLAHQAAKQQVLAADFPQAFDGWGH